MAAVLGATAAAGLDALTFAVSALGLAMIRLRVRGRDTEPPLGGDLASIRLGFLAGVRFIWCQPTLRALTVLLSAITFLSLGLTDVFIYYVRNGLHQGQQAVGVVLGLASAGSIVAASLTPALRRHLGFGACWLGSYALGGVAVVLVGLTTNFAFVAAMAALFSFGGTLAGVCSMTLRQEITPDRLLGRVTAAFWTLHSALGPVGAALITFTVGKAGVKIPMVGVGMAFLAIVATGLLTPVRQRNPGPALATRGS